MNYTKNSKGEKSAVLYLIEFFVFEIVLVLVCLGFVLAFKMLDSHGKSELAAVVFEQKPSVTVIIDAGHGGEDGGAVSDSGIVEKDINLDIALKTKSFFEVFGVDAVLTRDKDVLLYEQGQEKQKKFHDISNRISFVEKYDNPVVVSIHQNKFPIRKYSGFQVYYSKNNEKSKVFAQILQENVVSNLQQSNTRKIKQADKNIRLLDSLGVPAVLAECGFLSNPEETALLSNEEYRNKIAYLICISVMQYINECEDS